ncbi:transposase [Niallia circulans]|uniref:transposase n=1 Tax=Niallia circulans TaxID=1397 RepID=UPI0034C5F695
MHPIELKSVYSAESFEVGQQAPHSFGEKWKYTYLKVTKPLLNNPYLFTFYSFPKPIWRSIYSTNLIGAFNKQIKKYSKRKEQFPNEESLERFLISQVHQYN